MEKVSNTTILPCFIVLLLLIIILGVAVFFYIRYNNKKMRNEIKEQNHQDLMAFKTSITDMNKQLLDDIFEVMSSKEKPLDEAEAKKQHQQELINTFQKLRRIIKDDLTTTMNDTNACRIALYLLHNGTKSNGGIDFIKVSCVGEKILIGSGVKEQILNHSNMPINIFDNMLEKLIENGRYIVMNDDETMATARAQFISTSKIRYSQQVSVYDGSNNMLGFVLGEYDHVYNKNTSDMEYEILSKFAKKISPILSYSDYSSLTLISRTQ